VIGQIVVIESPLALDGSSTSNDQFYILKKNIDTLLEKRQFKKACYLILQPLFYVLTISACKNNQFCYLDMLLQYLPYFDMTLLAPRLLNAISKTLSPDDTINSNAIHFSLCHTKFSFKNTLPNQGAATETM